MKKTIIIIALLAFVGGLRGQDTIQMQDMRLMSNYYVPVWFDEFIADSTDKRIMAYLLNDEGWNRDKALEEAVRMYTDDTLQVYGIAVSLSSWIRLYPQDLERVLDAGVDTSHALSYDYLRLYESDCNTPRHIGGEELEVNLRYTPVSYYLDLDMYENSVVHIKLPILPMYERYFSAPITVADTFYVGRRYGHSGPLFSSCMIAPQLANKIPPYPDIHRAYNLSFVRSITDTRTGEVAYDTVRGWRHEGFNREFIPFIFPILAPPDTVTPIDTVTPGGDTLGVQTADLVSRYVSVMPNPARERAEVLSSFGLTKIELYDEQGRLLRTLPATGLRATLDLHSLPPSTYLLRIHTPAGITTKKLLVR